MGNGMTGTCGNGGWVRGKGKGKVDHTPQESVGRYSSPSSRPWARRWRTTNVCDAWPVRRQLPSQPQGITAHWLVPNYTAWRQRHMCVNNFPRVALHSGLAGIRTGDLLIASPAPTVMSPSHTVCRDGNNSFCGDVKKSRGILAELKIHVTAMRQSESAATAALSAEKRTRGPMTTRNQTPGSIFNNYQWHLFTKCGLSSVLGC